MGRGTPDQTRERFLACTWAQSRRRRAKNIWEALVATCAGPSLRDSCATRPPPRGILGTLSPLTFHSGEFQDTAFQEVGDRGRAAGGGLAARLAPWPWQLVSVLGWGPWPSCPDLSLSQALSPGPQDGGVSVSSSPCPCSLCPPLLGQSSLHLPSSSPCPPWTPSDPTRPFTSLIRGPNHCLLSPPPCRLLGQ